MADTVTVTEKDTVVVTGENTFTVVTVGVQGPAGISGSSVPATTSTIGGIIVGDNLAITGNGVLSAQPGGVTAFNNRTGNVSLTSSDVTTALATPFSCLTFTGTSSAYPFFFDILNSNGTESVGTFSQTDSNNRYVYTGQRIIGATVLGNGVTRTYFPSVRLVRDKTNTVNDRLEIDYSWTENATTGPVYSTTLALKANGLSLSSTSQDSSGQNYGLIVTKPYADARYTLTACFTYLSATVTNQYILINDLDGRLTNLEPLVDLKLPSANFTYANLTGTPTTLAGYGITDGLTSANLTPYLTTANATATYAVLGHTHSIANVTGLQTALDAKLPSANFTYANLTGTPNLTLYLTTANAAATYSVLTHTHVIANVTGLQTALDSKLPSANLTYANLTGPQNLLDTELIRAKLRDYSETVSSPTISAGTLTLNLETSNIFTVSLNAAITTLTISNPPASGSGGSFTLIFTADGTPRSVNWTLSSGVIKWAGGTAPTLTSTSGKVDSFAFFTSDGGTTWQGYIGGQNF